MVSSRKPRDVRERTSCQERSHDVMQVSILKSFSTSFNGTSSMPTTTEKSMSRLDQMSCQDCKK